DALAVEVLGQGAAGEAAVGGLGRAAVGVAVTDVGDLAAVAHLVDDRALAFLSAHRARLAVAEVDNAAVGREADVVRDHLGPAAISWKRGFGLLSVFIVSIRPTEMPCRWQKRSSDWRSDESSRQTVS